QIRVAAFRSQPTLQCGDRRDIFAPHLRGNIPSGRCEKSDRLLAKSRGTVPGGSVSHSVHNPQCGDRRDISAPQLRGNIPSVPVLPGKSNPDGCVSYKAPARNAKTNKRIRPDAVASAIFSHLPVPVLPRNTNPDGIAPYHHSGL